MDTEAFLLERDEIRRRLADHRALMEILHEEGRETEILGMGLREWAGLLLGALPGRGIWRWLPRSLAAFAAPMTVSVVKRRWRDGSPLARIWRGLRRSRFGF